MPFRSPKMNSFIFGFHRFVWWPKCTPASSRSFIAIPDNRFLPCAGTPPRNCASGTPPLTFAELEPLPGASQTVLLAFLDSRIGRQQAVLLQLLAQLRVELDECPRDAEPHGARLSVDAAAGDGGEHVEF